MTHQASRFCNCLRTRTKVRNNVAMFRIVSNDFVLLRTPPATIFITHPTLDTCFQHRTYTWDTLQVLRTPGDTMASILACIKALINVLVIYYNNKTRDYHILGLLHIYFLIIFHLLHDLDIFFHCLMFRLMFASWPSSFLVLCLSKTYIYLYYLLFSTRNRLHPSYII